MPSLKCLGELWVSPNIFSAHVPPFDIAVPLATNILNYKLQALEEVEVVVDSDDAEDADSLKDAIDNMVLALDAYDKLIAGDDNMAIPKEGVKIIVEREGEDTRGRREAQMGLMATNKGEG
ncbi:hypothetical protein OPV22_012991 [Ensete ventricosum]|uniref:Uncharacterized protein n=1 Tax=Ensete ventricosum TaxID=4639 RepID=A0AAV8R4D8_ENSVE|nr:hypothetical protein OPV22_012991 [Ensete ventricosum]